MDSKEFQRHSAPASRGRAPLLAGAYERLLLGWLDRARHGLLAVRGPDGREHEFGGSLPGPRAEWIIHDWRVAALVARRGDVGLAEGYMEDMWDSPGVEDFYRWLIANLAELRAGDGSGLHRLLGMLRDRLLRRNSPRVSQKNIIAHYDLGNEFFALFLDPGMTYSSALFAGKDISLEQAQRAKYDRLLDMLDGHESLLEIGCGWGACAERAVERGHRLAGITLSPAQLEYARRRLDGRADLKLLDYRKAEGQHDGVVSIEMFEAVGERYWPAWMRAVHGALRPGGRAAVQIITIAEDAFAAYRRGTDFIRAYVFPGGMLSTESAFTACAEAAGLAVEDRLAFADDYARTLRLWLRGFEHERAAVQRLGFSRRFIRTWRLYLAVCAAGFASGRTDVLQLALRRAA
ncbi:MAG: class I SAM-dependent methyltransferase [Betaproteobacteria bacterium AqS2]|uniref:Class I SAM-dependent methyltransferase n=1 Tax=Candidatus Amphirhobacter heronislandensis TaxID=1732024 RepID=A0A930Y337_9GAMM|nr:class I SAM-dependent methyltransferase [Betaproteobacteria bacterium AqS2]